MWPVLGHKNLSLTVSMTQRNMDPGRGDHKSEEKVLAKTASHRAEHRFSGVLPLLVCSSLIS